MQAVQARMKLMMAISSSAACNDQTDLAHLVRRGISWACLQGLVGHDEAGAGHTQPAFKLHSILVADVDQHLEQQIYAPAGCAPQRMQDLLLSPDYRSAALDTVIMYHSSYVIFNWIEHSLGCASTWTACSGYFPNTPDFRKILRSYWQSRYGQLRDFAWCCLQ